MRVVVPSARLVSTELQNVGKLPPIIYPMGQGIVLDYLLKQYENHVDQISIICHECIEKVEERVKTYYNDKIEIRKTEQLDCLGDTIYSGLDEKNHGSVIINYADTVLTDMHVPDKPVDIIYYTEEYVTDTWTYFDEENGKLVSVWDKKKVEFTEKKKLFVGVFVLSDEACFKEILLKKKSMPEDGMEPFYSALMEYSETYPIEFCKTDSWLDIGHAKKYYDARLEVEAREFNQITVDKHRGILTKTSDNQDKFIGEIKWYLKLPKELEYVCPRIFSYSTHYEDAYVSMEYYSYHTLHELLLNGNLNHLQWREIFGLIKFILRDFGRYCVTGEAIEKSIYEIYLNKTIHRLETITEEEKFSSWYQNAITINGKTYQSLKHVMEKLKVEIPKRLLGKKEFNIIHGDLCFSNIMVDSNFMFIKLIDPRGNFGEYDLYGDPRYELAKLFHSVDGQYDYIIKNRFLMSRKSENNFSYSMQNVLEFDLYAIMKDVFKEEIGDSLEEIEFIEALLFLGMIALHGENEKHQYIMLAKGYEILNRYIDIEER